MRTDLRDRRRALRQRLLDLSNTRDRTRFTEGRAGEQSDVLDRGAASHHREAELASIHAALRRMDNGDYGQCASCGALIAKERLDAFPFTPHCGACPPLSH